MSYEMEIIAQLKRLNARMDNVIDSLDKVVKMMKKMAYKVGE